MTQDCLKLTTYFGERKRSGRQFVADALLDLYGRHQIATSILLRGMEGFGLKHHLRTDQSLTLSEDLPSVAVAVDTRPRIERLLEEAVLITKEGLVTLERARMQNGQPDMPTTAADHSDATKLTIYLGRHERVFGVPAFVAVCDLLYRRGIAGASVLLGVDGTVHGNRERAQFFGRNAHVPVMVIAIGDGDRLEPLVPELGSLVRHPVITEERVQVCKRDGQLLATPHELPGTDEHGMALWQKLTILTSESQLHNRRPIHREITRRLRAAGAAGATTLRGVWGFHGDHAPHGDRVLQLGRHVPAMTIVIDSPQRVPDWFAVIDELTAEHGLVTSELVPALRTSATDHVRGGLHLARHRY